MSGPMVVYVCVGTKRPVRVEFPEPRTFESGDLFLFAGGMVEVKNVYAKTGQNGRINGRIPVQLEVMEVYGEC